MKFKLSQVVNLTTILMSAGSMALMGKAEQQKGIQKRLACCGCGLIAGIGALAVNVAGATAGTLNTLVNFDGTNGANPFFTRLLQSSNGDFFGTTEFGGTNNDGTVFKLTPHGKLTTLVNFNGTNGTYPHGRLIQASNGDFFGTTVQGGIYGLGTVFEQWC